MAEDFCFHSVLLIMVYKNMGTASVENLFGSVPNKLEAVVFKF